MIRNSGEVSELRCFRCVAVQQANKQRVNVQDLAYYRSARLTCKATFCAGVEGLIVLLSTSDNNQSSSQDTDGSML